MPRRFSLACMAGGLLAGFPFTWLVGTGRLDPLQRHPLGGFFDAQAHSLLDLRWDVPADVLALEAFFVDDRAYMYFGPVPALLRLPVAAFTSRFDGRLTSLSMLAAFALTLYFASRLSWRTRQLLRGDGPVTRVEAAAVGAFTFLLGAGTTLSWLAGQAYVFHEAILWGVALSIAAYDALARGSTVRAGAFTTLAVLTRASVGLGPLAAMALLLAVKAVGALRDRRRSEWRSLAPLLVACAVPVVLYAAVNQAKFGSLFSVPWEDQLIAQVDEDVKEALEDNGGNLFGLRYAPTTAIQYLRPDALDLDRPFPWVAFPPLAEEVGDVRFHRIDRSSSLLSSMPWLVVLACLGITALVRRRGAGARRAAVVLWAPLLGASAAALVTVATAYVAQRYLGDAIPLLLLAGLVGLHHLLARLDGRSGGSVGAARAGLVAMAVLGLCSTWTNLGLGLVFQRQFGFADEEVRAELVAWQHDADRLLPGKQAPRLRQGGSSSDLPGSAREGELFVVGDCDGMYQFDGVEWRPVERTAAVGRFRLEVLLPETEGSSRQTLLHGGERGERRSLAVESREDGAVVFVLSTPERPDIVQPAVGLRPGRRYVLDVAMDRRLGSVQVRAGGQEVGVGPYTTQDDELRPADGLRALATGTPVCQSLLGSSS